MKKATLLLCQFILCTFPLFSQDQELAELSKLITTSFNHHPKLMADDAAIRIADERLRLTSINNRPELNADLNYAYVMPRIELPINGQKVQFSPVNSVNSFLSGSYVLLDFGRQKSALDRARNEWLMAEHTKAATAFGLAYQVASIYYQLLYLRRALSIQDTTIRVLEAARHIAHTQYREGAALAIDSMSIQSSLLLEENRKTELRTLQHQQEILLEYATGQTLSEAARVMPIIQSLVRDSIHPDVLLMTDKLNQAKLDVQSSQLKARPLMAIKALAGLRNGYVPDVTELRFNYSAGIGISMPIYSAGKIRQQVRVQERIADRQASLLTLTNMELAKDEQLAEAELRSAQERLSNFPGQIQLADQILQIALSKFRNGAGLYLEVISAGGGLQKAMLGLLQGQLQVCMMQLELARLRGVRFWAAK